MSLLFGLTAALSWGLAEFMTRHATRRLGWVRAFIGVQLAGLLTLGAFLAWQKTLPSVAPQVWMSVAGLGLCNAAATLLIYKAFEIGNLSIVSPVAAGFAVVTALLALAHGERPAALALAGAALLVAGVMTIALHRDADGGPGRGATWAGMPQALGSAFCFGVTFWGLGFVTPALGVSWSLFVLRGIAAAGAFVGLARGLMRAGVADAVVTPVALPPGVPAMPDADAAPVQQTPLPLRACLRHAPIVAGIMAADTAGWLAFNAGVRGNSTAIVTALASLSSAVTVLLACVFLRERLAPKQWAGVGAILLGVLLVSLP